MEDDVLRPKIQGIRENESGSTANCVGTAPFAQCAVPSTTEPPYGMMAP